MPFCTKCGTEVRQTDRFCRRCGTAQPGTAAASGKTGAGISERGATILCYLPWMGWLVAVWALLSDRFRQNRQVRFHAYQGLYIFVIWLLGRWALDLWAELLFDGRVPLGSLVELLLLGLWIFMLVKTSYGENYRLPVLGELAERSI